MKGKKMKPTDRQMLLDSILEAFACFDPTPEEVAAVLAEVQGAWEDIRDNLTENGWIEKQRFSRDLTRKLRDLYDNRAEAYWTERNTFDDALGRKCDAAAAVEAARALK